MLVPLSWLASYVDLPAASDRGPGDSWQPLLARLTGLGHMVDAPLADTPAGPVVSLEIRQNRPDCLSVLGIAREVAAAYATGLREPALAELPPALGMPGAAGWPDRLSLLSLRGVRLGPLPGAVLRRLEGAGLRPVGPLVDLANYVMLELGQPLHVYAADRADVTTMEVRQGRPGERLALLDGRTVELGPDDLLVADASGPLALAGVIGGRESAVEGAPGAIVVEAGSFRPHLVRRTARRHGLQSEAGLRSSKLLPPALAAVALARFLALLAEHGAYEAAELRASHPAPTPPAPIRLAHADIARVGGLELAPVEAAAILHRLGMAASLEDNGATVAAAPPPWRSDLTGPADLIEELLRVAGYERIAPVALPALAPGAPGASAWEQEERLRELLGAWGYDEVILDSFLLDPPAALAARPDLLRVANPPAGSDALRPALLPNIVGAARYLPLLGARRRLCEIGHTFRNVDGRPDERRAAAWLELRPDRPADGGAADYYALKAEALAALAALGTPAAREEPGGLPFPMLPGRGARLLGADGSELGAVGLLDQRAYGLTPAQSAVGAEIALPEPSAAAAWAGRPRREAARVDLSYSLGPGCSPAALAAAIRDALGDDLIELRLIDRYAGEGGAASATYRAIYAAGRGAPREVWATVRALVEASTTARARG